jgi:hypothetical protein
VPYLELLGEILNHFIEESAGGLLCAEYDEIHRCIAMQEQTFSQHAHTHNTLQHTGHLTVVLIPMKREPVTNLTQ